eukprot:6992380-Prymnesium_polylepis.4
MVVEEAEAEEERRAMAEALAVAEAAEREEVAAIARARAAATVKVDADAIVRALVGDATDAEDKPNMSTAGLNPLAPPFMPALASVAVHCTAR